MTKETLEYFGKEAAKEYLQNSVPLNDTITKIAEENALTKEQINRVTEAANTTTYLALFKTAEDKYIEFPVADSEKIAEYLKPVSYIPNTLDDYGSPPKSMLDDNTEIFPVEEGALEKESSIKGDREKFQEHILIKYAEEKP